MRLTGPLEELGPPPPYVGGNDHTDDEDGPEDHYRPGPGKTWDTPAVVVDDQEVVVGRGEIDLPALREDRERSSGEHRRAEEDDDDQRRDVPEKLDVKGGETGHQPVLRETGYADQKTHHRGENDPEEGGEEGVLDPDQHHLPYR